MLHFIEMHEHFCRDKLRKSRHYVVFPAL